MSMEGEKIAVQTRQQLENKLNEFQLSTDQVEAILLLADAYAITTGMLKIREVLLTVHKDLTNFNQTLRNIASDLLKGGAPGPGKN